MQPLTIIRDFHEQRMYSGFPHIPTRNNIHAHAVSKELLNYQGEWLPADLSHLALEKASDKFFCEKRDGFDETTMNEALQITSVLYSIMDNSYLTPATVLPSLIDRSTSVGVALSSFKTKGKLVDNPYMFDQIIKSFEEFMQGKETYDCACLKVELRDKLRVNDHKTRIFCSVCITKVMHSLHLFSDMNSKIYENPFSSPCQAGINPYFDWEQLYHILKMKENFGFKTVASDFSNFDNSVSAHLFSYIAKFRFEKLAPHLQTYYNKVAILAYYENLSNAIIVLDSKLYRTFGGQKSGAGTTIADNSILVVLVKVYCIIKFLKTYQSYLTESERSYIVSSQFKFHTVGDDGLDSFPTWFPVQYVVSTLSSEFNMTINFEEKDGIDNVTFLSSYFKYDSTIRRIIKVADATKIKESVCFYKGVIENHQSRLESALINAFYHKELWSVLARLYVQLYGPLRLSYSQIKRIYTHAESSHEVSVSLF
jgi:hypothetical protein